MHFTCSELCDVSQNKQCFSKLCPLKPRKLLLGVQRPDLMKYSCAHIFTLKASSVNMKKVNPLFLEDKLCCWLLSCVVQTPFFLKV